MPAPTTAAPTLVRAYLDRIGLADRDPDGLTGAEAITDVVAGHNAAIPFENLDPITDVAVDDLSLSALVDKLVTRRRGGYCYEHNALLAHVLRALGHEVDLLTGRVVMGSPEVDDDALTRLHRTHAALAVTPADGGERLLVDVGFGGQTLTSPIRFDDDAVQPTRHEPYRFRPYGADGTRRLLEAEVAGEWRPLYVLGLDPHEVVDLEVGSWWVSMNPRSGFRRGLTVARATADARLNLRGTTLTTHHRDGRTEKTELDGVDGVLAALRDTFGIDPDGVLGLASALARVLDLPPAEGTSWFWDFVAGRRPPPPAAATLGMQVVAADPAGTFEATFEALPTFANAVGRVQGGFLAAMLDATLGPALAATLEAHQFLPTLELKVNYLRPASPGRLRGRGRVVHRGRGIAFLAGELHDEEDQVLATATATARIVTHDWTGRA